MGKMWMPVQNFKKVAEDDKSATLRHPDGHEVKIVKSIMSPHMKAQLDSLPLHGQNKMAKGGKVKGYDEGGCIPLPAEDGPGGPPAMIGYNPNAGKPSIKPTMPQPQQPQGPTNASIPSPAARPQVGNPMTSGMPGLFGGRSPIGLMQSGMNLQQQAGREAMNATQAGAGMAMGAANGYIRNLQQDMDAFNNGFIAPNGRRVPGFKERLQEADNVKSDVLAGNINPNHWMEQGALPKVITALGLIGAMSNSKGAGEQILNFVNQQMDRDMQSQVANRNTKLSVLDANIKLMGTMQDGLKMTQAQHLGVYQALIEKAKAATDNKMAKAQYDDLLGKLQQQKANLVQQWTVADVLSNGMPQSQAQAQGSPAGQGKNMQTDAMGNPVTTGQGVNLGASAPYFQQYNPVTMPGGAQMFAKGQKQGEDAQAATKDWADLNDAIKDVHESTKNVSIKGWLPGSAEREKRQGAIDRLNTVITRLAGQGKLKPQQVEALQNMTKGLVTNPLPGFLGQNRQEEMLKGMARQNTDQLQNTYDQDLMNFQHPLKPEGEREGD